jgi:hypothetical protein
MFYFQLISFHVMSIEQAKKVKKKIKKKNKNKNLGQKLFRLGQKT